MVRRVDPLVHLPPARGGPLNAKSPLQSREGPVETFRLIRDAFLKANILGGHCGALRNTHTHTHTHTHTPPGHTQKNTRVKNSGARDTPPRSCRGNQCCHRLIIFHRAREASINTARGRGWSRTRRRLVINWSCAHRQLANARSVVATLPQRTLPG